MLPEQISNDLFSNVILLTLGMFLSSFSSLKKPAQSQKNNAREKAI